MTFRPSMRSLLYLLVAVVMCARQLSAFSVTMLNFRSPLRPQAASTTMRRMPFVCSRHPKLMFAVNLESKENISILENDGTNRASENLTSSEQHLDESTQPDFQHLASRALNAAFLVLSFGSALYAIIHTDMEMTRGWTASEIAMRTSVDNWSLYEDSLAEKPIFTKTFINTIIFLLGDWLNQTMFQKKNVLDFDILRTFRNGFIGMCFGPLVHEYYKFSDYILPVEGGIQNRIAKIFMDQTIYLTVKCSIYIAAVGLLQGDDVPTVRDTVKGRIVPIVTTAWRFWPFIHLITYSVIPDRHRILWVNVVDILWNSILAGLSQKQTPEEVAAAAQLMEKDLTVETTFALGQEAFPMGNSTVTTLFATNDTQTVHDASMVRSTNTTAATSTDR